MAWVLCNMEQQSRSNVTNATNATNNQAADKTSSITPEHIFGLIALNPGPTSPCSSFSIPSVTDSVRSAEFTETNPEALRGLGIDASEQEAPVIDMDNTSDKDADVMDVHNASEQEAPAIDQEQNSTGAALSVPLQQVCLFFYFQDHPVTKN